MTIFTNVSNRSNRSPLTVPSHSPWLTELRQRVFDEGVQAGFYGYQPSVAQQGARAALEEYLAAERGWLSDIAPSRIKRDLAILTSLDGILADPDPYRRPREDWESARRAFRETPANIDGDLVSKPLAVCAIATGLGFTFGQRLEPRDAIAFGAMITALIVGAPALVALANAASPACSAGVGATCVAASLVSSSLLAFAARGRIRVNQEVIDRHLARTSRLKAVLLADCEHGFALGSLARNRARFETVPSAPTPSKSSRSI